MAGDSSDLPRFITREGKILPGVRRVVNVPNPAAGALWSVNVPAGVMWHIRSAFFNFSTDATVLNRQMQLVVTEDDFITWQSGSTAAQAASLFGYYTFAPNLTPSVIGGSQNKFQAPAPDYWLPSQASIGVGNTTLGPTDEFINIAISIEELYATDQVLSEWHEREMEAYRAAIT